MFILANTVATIREYANLTQETVNNADGSITLNVEVTGGIPAPNRFEWTLPDNVLLTPGDTSGSYRALLPRVSIH